MDAVSPLIFMKKNKFLQHKWYLQSFMQGVNLIKILIKFLVVYMVWVLVV